MAWINSLFRKRDIVVLIAGFAIMQVLAFLLIDRFMFCPMKGGYDETLEGYIDIGTNDMSVAARIIGPQKGKKVVIYCHGNAEDLTALEGRFEGLVEKGYAVATFDYPGYGLSDGAPDEDGCYRNAFRLYDWLVNDKGYQADDIVVMGYSIGTGVAIELATNRDVCGLWLESAYLSAPRAVTKIRILFADPFSNIGKISKIKCPLVMLHGTADSIIPYWQGRELFECAMEPKWFIPIPGANHIDYIYTMGVDKYNAGLLEFMQRGRLGNEFCNEK